VIARPQKPVDNVFFHSGDHRSPLQYVLKRYVKLKFEKGVKERRRPERAAEVFDYASAS
jgi:hypothetical protein